MAQLTVPVDSARFSKGMTWKDYMAQMGETQKRTEDNYNKASLSADDKKFFSGVKGVKYVLMLAENWCGAAGLPARPEPRHHRLLPQQRLPFDPGRRLLRRELERDRPLDRAQPPRHREGGDDSEQDARHGAQGRQGQTGRGHERLPRAGQRRVRGAGQRAVARGGR